MPKLTTRMTNNNQNRYSLPPSMTSSQAAMAYYNLRAPSSVTPGYYDAIPSTAAPMQASMAAAYEPYAVAPLTLPPSTHMPAVASQLPAQHRTASTAWSSQDDAELLQLRASGKNWKDIHDYLMEHTGKDKSANACRKRHERLIASRNADGPWLMRATPASASSRVPGRPAIIITFTGKATSLHNAPIACKSTMPGTNKPEAPASA